MKKIVLISLGLLSLLLGLVFIVVFGFLFIFFIVGFFCLLFYYFKVCVVFWRNKNVS